MLGHMRRLLNECILRDLPRSPYALFTATFLPIAPLCDSTGIAVRSNEPARSEPDAVLVPHLPLQCVAVPRVARGIGRDIEDLVAQIRAPRP